MSNLTDGERSVQRLPQGLSPCRLESVTDSQPRAHQPYAMKTVTSTTARTDPINEQGGWPTSLGHRALDQLVAVDQVILLDDRMTDLDHRQRVLVVPRLIDRKHGFCRKVAFSRVWGSVSH